MLEIQVQVRLAGQFPDAAEWGTNIALREALAEVGVFAGGGSGGGVMDNWVSVEIAQCDGALARIDEILKRLNLADRTSVRVRDLTPMVAENPSTPSGAGFPEGHPEIVGQLLTLGRTQNNLLTYDQLNDHLPEETHSTEQIDAWLRRLGDDGLEIGKALEPDDLPEVHVNNLAVVAESEPTCTCEEPRIGPDEHRQIVEYEASRRWTGLTRDDEIELAKRIEAYEASVVRAIVASSLLLGGLSSLGDQLRAGTIGARISSRTQPTSTMYAGASRTLVLSGSSWTPN